MSAVSDAELLRMLGRGGAPKPAPKIVPAETTTETVVDIALDEEDSKPPPVSEPERPVSAGGGGKPPPAPVDRKDLSAEEQRAFDREQRKRAREDQLKRGGAAPTTPAAAPAASPARSIDLSTIEGIEDLAKEMGMGASPEVREFARRMLLRREEERMAKENPAALARRREAEERVAQRRADRPMLYVPDTGPAVPRLGREDAALRAGTTPQSQISTGGFVRAPGIPAQLKVRPEEAEAGLGRVGSTVAKDSEAGRSILAARREALGEDIAELRDARVQAKTAVRDAVAAYGRYQQLPARRYGHRSRTRPSFSMETLGPGLLAAASDIRSGKVVGQSRAEDALLDEVVEASDQFQRMQNATRQIQMLRAIRDQIGQELEAAEPQE